MKLTPLFNRSGTLPDDGWYHVVPLGQFTVKHSGTSVLQVLDDRAVASMARRFLDGGEKLLVDFEHFSYSEDQRSEAAGWIVGVEARESGLWAQIEWTDAGEPAILNKRYRFVSPVWLPEDCEPLGSDRLRPLRLDTVGLTNAPNLKGMQPLSNRGGAERLPNSHRSKENNMNEVLELLGLSADAAEDAALAAVAALKNKAGEADALKNRAETAEGKVQAMEAAQLDAEADAFCDKHAAWIGNRAEVKAQYIANRDGAKAIFACLRAHAVREPDSGSLRNRATKQPGSPDSPPDAAAQQQASAIRNRAHQIAKEQNVSFPVAFERANSEATK